MNQGGNVIVQLSGVARRICSGKICILPRDVKMSGYYPVLGSVSAIPGNGK